MSRVDAVQVLPRLFNSVSWDRTVLVQEVVWGRHGQPSDHLAQLMTKPGGGLHVELLIHLITSDHLSVSLTHANGNYVMSLIVINN